MWLFGYGSLIWKAGFPWVERRPARIRGWVRRFYQGSTDHRGVPGAPGRVVTLLPEWGGCCAGVAYRLDAEVIDDVLAALDHREKGGYRREGVEVQDPGDGQVFAEAIVYRALPDNEHWLGPDSVPHMARQIAASYGPSGPNSAYLEALHASLTAMSEPDPHVRSLVAAMQCYSDPVRAAGSPAARPQGSLPD